MVTLSGASTTLNPQANTFTSSTLTGVEADLREGTALRDRNVFTGTPIELKPDTGVIIPGDFVGVDIVVRDQDGNELPEVIRVLSADKPSLAAQIDDTARGTIQLLQNTYENFYAIADTGEDGYRITWLSTDDTKELNPATLDLQAEHEVTIEKVEASAGDPSNYVFVSGKPVLVGQEGSGDVFVSGRVQTQ